MRRIFDIFSFMVWVVALSHLISFNFHLHRVARQNVHPGELMTAVLCVLTRIYAGYRSSSTSLAFHEAARPSNHHYSPKIEYEDGKLTEIVFRQKLTRSG